VWIHNKASEDKRHLLKKRFVIDSRGAAQTRRIGRVLGQFLKPGALVALSGELGSGKTEFVKGLASGLGVNRCYQVSSPSFVLINEYPGRIPLFHLDLYRLSGRKDLDEMGLEEYFYGQGVTAIEWAEKATTYLPPEHIWIEIRWRGPNSRQLIIKAFGKRNGQALEATYKKTEVPEKRT
jgi:tRNA threonylcarbamoyladenosine biosynthesis protein TsaE